MGSAAIADLLVRPQGEVQPDGLQDLQNLDRGACDLLPVFAEYGHLPGFEAAPAFLVGAAAGAIVLLEGLQVLNKWQENWILTVPPAKTCATGSISSSRRPAPAAAARRADQPPSHGRTFQVVARPRAQGRDDRRLLSRAG